jgi:hypothetical protein
MDKMLREGDAMTSDYANGRCCAITKDGKRCTGRWASAVPCIIRHTQDGTNVTIIDGPCVVLCHRHRHWLFHDGKRSLGDGKTRFRILHGWLGSANPFGYGTSVFSAPTGWKAAKWWAARAREMKFGESRRDCP